MCWSIRPLRGSASACRAGMAAAGARSRSAPPQPSGVMAGCPSCRSAGFSCAIISAALTHRLCSAPTRPVTRFRCCAVETRHGVQSPAAMLSASNVDVASQVAPLLDQVGPLASFTADGAYDQDGVYGEVAKRSPDALVIVPPRCSAVPSGGPSMHRAGRREGQPREQVVFHVGQASSRVASGSRRLALLSAALDVPLHRSAIVVRAQGGVDCRQEAP